MGNSRNRLGPKKHIAIVEAGRGFAAIYVLVYHVVQTLGLQAYHPKGSFMYYIVHVFDMYAYEAVLFFFLLSGFSIHYSSIDRDLGNCKGIWNYYYLRFRRIYPIFLLAILASISLIYIGFILDLSGYNEHLNNITSDNIILSLFFLTDRSYIDGYIAATLPNNGPLWSLSYEIVYYLIYPAYWILSKKFGKSMPLIIAFLLFLFFLVMEKIIEPNHLGNVMGLYIIWCLGAFIAELKRSENMIYVTRMGTMICLGLIYIFSQSIWVISGLSGTFGDFHELIWAGLFFSIMLFFIVGNQALLNRNDRLLLITIFISGTLLIDAVSVIIKLSNDEVYFYSGLHLTALLLLSLTWQNTLTVKSFIRKILVPFVVIGPYSYALYIFHMPILDFAHETLLHYGAHELLLLLIIPIILLMASFIEINYRGIISKKMDLLANKLLPSIKTDR